MTDSMVPGDGPENDAFHRLTARLATLDLDPRTLEMLTAVLTADLDPRSGEVDLEAEQSSVVPATA
jgi:hypothetical protein